ncbi:VanZ family protein [Vogesella oryzae]|uniref:VanZ family protein n=1 Tax=Vogesella oryzae TaxID=1735285 RepID=UPI001582034F|nr:VanZ family protein [Vogesella oryzae]
MPVSRYWLPAWLWWLLSLWLLFKPAGVPSGIPYLDKIGHFALFLAGGVLLAWPRLRQGAQAAALWRPTLSLCLAWAVGSELGQGLLTATRSAEVGDALADMLGAVAGVMLAAWAIAWRQRQV